MLVAPVLAFILAAMFIAVYWPQNVQPDGGLAVMDGAGWVPILVTLLYTLIWLQAGPLAAASGRISLPCNRLARRRQAAVGSWRMAPPAAHMRMWRRAVPPRLPAPRA